VRAGIGEPVFFKFDARIAAAILSIGACKRVEFGAGFAAAAKKGSENNDEPLPSPAQGFKTNNSGGILGGISTGQSIFFSAAFKPTPSIGKRQNVLHKDGSIMETVINGRHDVCIVPRAVPVVEAMTALVLADFMLLARATLLPEQRRFSLF
jgi:chorismate synthase